MDDVAVPGPARVLETGEKKTKARANTSMQVELQLPRETVRRIVDQVTNRRVMKGAIDLARFYGEEDIRKLMEKADAIAEIAGRATIQPGDVSVARKRF